MKQKIMLSDFISEMSAHTYDFAGVPVGETETLNVFTSSTFTRTLSALYDERCFYTNVDINNMQAVESDFFNVFDLWRTTKLNDVLRAFNALKLEYAPLENYDSTEQTTTSYGKIDTLQKNTKDTNTKNLIDANTKNLENKITYNSTDTTNDSTYGFNSTTAVPSDISNTARTGNDTTTNTGTDTTTHSGTDATEHTGTDTNTASGKDIISVTRHGNIGVTTSQQMLESELNLRMKNFVFDLIHNFIETFTTY